jgi:hypothetical protein
MATKIFRLLKGCKPLLSLFFFLFPILLLLLPFHALSPLPFGVIKEIWSPSKMGILDDNRKDSVAIQHIFIVRWLLKDFSHHSTLTPSDRNQNSPKKENGA